MSDLGIDKIEDAFVPMDGSGSVDRPASGQKWYPAHNKGVEAWGYGWANVPCSADTYHGGVPDPSHTIDGVAASGVQRSSGWLGIVDTDADAKMNTPLILSEELYAPQSWIQLDDIVDPTCPRTAGSGKLLETGMESHGRNPAAMKRPFYAPFMAPGILFNLSLIHI